MTEVIGMRSRKTTNVMVMHGLATFGRQVVRSLSVLLVLSAFSALSAFSVISSPSESGRPG